MGPIFLHANAGKRSIVLDLKHPAGRDAALKLAEGCDVLISDVRPQAMARLGLHYEAVRAAHIDAVYAEVARTQPPAPRLGEHTRALLAEAGCTPAQIDALLAQGACRSTQDSAGEPA